jgi:nicotinamidase-related amidase
MPKPEENPMSNPKFPLEDYSEDPNLHLDPLKGIYHESFVENPAHFQYLISKSTALLVVDMQYLDAAEGHGIFKDPESSGVPREGQEYYFNTLNKYVIPNIRNLQNSFREHGLEVIHIRIMSLTNDGRDRSPGHKRLNILAPYGSKEAEFLPEVAPLENEIVINKTASGVFSSTNINYVLRNMGVNALFVVGVYTNECVETTVRDACDLGYLATVVEDCCTTVTPELHQASLATLRDRYARVITTEEALRDIDHFVARLRKGKTAAMPT